MKGFRIIGNKGFHLTFSNGYTVSVQFGPGNYCENCDKEFGSPEGLRLWESKDAEIAVWNGNMCWKTRQFYPDACDDVVGRQTADKVADLIHRVSLMPNVEEPEEED